MITSPDARFDDVVADLLSLPELHGSRERIHHFDLSEYDHLLDVARQAHRLSRYVKADARICARAGLLHDLGAHWFDTAAPCALAERLDEPEAVWHAIRAHTLIPELPRTREAWVVVAADLLTSAQECHYVFRRARTRAASRLRQRLLRQRLLRQRLTNSTRLLRPWPRLPRRQAAVNWRVLATTARGRFGGFFAEASGDATN